MSGGNRLVLVSHATNWRTSSIFQQKSTPSAALAVGASRDRLFVDALTFAQKLIAVRAKENPAGARATTPVASTTQPTALEQTTAGLEEMSASITQNAANAGQTEQMALQGGRDAAESGAAVQQAVGAMTTIADKISIIEDIAFILQGFERYHAAEMLVAPMLK